MTVETVFWIWVAIIAVGMSTHYVTKYFHDRRKK